MNRSTEKILNEINRRFYRQHAEAFASTRQAPWGGWEGLLEPLRAQIPGAIRVLDAGCGNGRFGEFLAGRWPPGVRYTGIDASPELLEIARRRLEGKVELDLRLQDLVVEGLTKPDTSLGTSPGISPGTSPGFDLAVTFGVLHHMPGSQQRLLLLEGLAGALRPGGFLALSIWLFGRDERFRRRLADWRSLPLSLGVLDPSELEAGDHLLRWGGDPPALRYCHALSDDEEQGWIDGLGLSVVRRYEADGRSGRLNRYLLLQSRTTP